MYINRVSSYIPEMVVPNSHFNQLNGLSEEWILSRTGIRERRKVQSHENTNTMVIQAIKAAEPSRPFPFDEIDLIVGATYTPYDTIHSLAHAAQNYLGISDIPVLSISTACSSFVNAMEVVEGYFAMGKAHKALVLVADHNTAYSDERDTVGGHLWGDGASAIFVSKEKLSETDFTVRDIITGGAGNIGKAEDGVVLRPANEGFRMNHGRDVFQYACQYMSKVTQDILEKNNYSLDDLAYFIPHQANLRITKNVAQTLGLSTDRALSNIEYLGNTGCAGCSIALYENQHRYKKGDLIVVTVFGGGYSYGAMLLEC
ncbi:MAG: ketoacyl-ACP synthase III [Microscillaceae bacterium]|nr:ketoacyl-ACP synthase III [Microscillaceae bacterium]